MWGSRKTSWDGQANKKKVWNKSREDWLNVLEQSNEWFLTQNLNRKHGDLDYNFYFSVYLQLGKCKCIYHILQSSFEIILFLTARLMACRQELVVDSVWPDWAIYCTLGNFLKSVATIILPELPTFLGSFCKGVKRFHFSSEMIFGQLFTVIWVLFTGHTGCCPLPRC